MVSASAGNLKRHLGRLFGAGSPVGLTDRDLLERCAHRRDQSAEAAFETILARHGAMVLFVCRQVLGDEHAAEDAFQATFLVLFRRAGSLRVRAPGALGPWLYGVAHHIASKARRGAARRWARERRVPVPAAGRTTAAIEQDELRALLHEEVNRLPAKYRAPVVLCYFEGRTHDEAAAVLRWPLGTVRGRLARARELLRARLTRRGLAPDGWIGGSLLGPAARIEPPARLLAATVAAAMGRMPSGAASAMANLLLRGLLVARLKMTGVVLSLFVIAAGIGLAVPGTPAPQVRTPTETAADTVATAPKPSTSLDRHGDPLPEYARARMGTIRFHDGSLVNQVFFTPDAKSLVTVDNIPIVRVWDATTGRAVREIGSSPAGLPQVTPSRRIALSPDGKTLATVDYPSRLRLWDVATGRERRSWREPKDQQYDGPIFSPDGRTLAVSVTRYDQASDTSETFIELWDTAFPTEHRHRIPGGWVRLWDLKFSPDGKILATASRDAHNLRGNVLIGPERGSTRIWDLATGREQRRFPVERLDVPSLAFSPDGKLLAAAVSDGTIRLYDLRTGHERMPRLGPELLKPPGGDVKAGRSRLREMGRLAFSPDGSILAVAAVSGDPPLATIDLWDVARGQELHRIPAHQHSVVSLSFAPDGKTLASTGDEPMVRLWDVATAREVFTQSGHRSAVSTVVVSPADGSVFTGSSDGTIRNWDPSSSRELDVVAQLSGPVEALCVSPDGKTLLVVSPTEAGWFGLWSVAERREMRRLGPLREHGVANAVYAPDGKTVASQGRIWETASGKLLLTLRHEAAANDWFLSWCPISYAVDGKQLITAEPDGAWIWDSATGRELRHAIRWSNHHDRATISPDGRFLATRGPGDPSGRGSDDQPIILWELASGQQVASLEALGEAYVRRPFSPDGRFLASACRHQGAMPDSTVRVLDLATGREVRRFEGHRGSVNALAFAPDGRSVVSGSEDATALIWDISDLSGRPKTGEPMAAEVLKARWDELAGNDAGVAYRATWALSVPRVIAFLRERLQPAASPDAERIPRKGPTVPPDVLRTLRAMTALERIGTPAARAVLEQMAQGNSGAIESREAKCALSRLTRRGEAPAGVLQSRP